MDQHEEKATRLGTEKVSSLLWKFSLPAIAAMAASSLYNVIAGIFIGHLGAYSISGVGLTMPIMSLTAAFGALVGVGASVVCSISLGEKDYPKARKALANLVILNFLIGITITAIGLAYLDPILLFFGASENTLEPAREFMQIILAGNVFAHMYLGLNAMLRVSGYPIVAMNLTFLSVGINLVLAPLFIFKMDMGVRGAALATVIAQVICCVISIALFMRKDRVVYFEADKFKLDRRIVLRSFSIGSPNFFTNACGCAIVIIQNYNFLKYGGDLYVGAFSIINRIVFLFFMIALGFSQGMQPIVAYNFGAEKYDRMWEAFRLTLICAFLVLITGTLCGELLPREMTSLFVSGESEFGQQLIEVTESGELLPSETTSLSVDKSVLDQQLIEITVDGFRKIVCCLWIIPLQVIGANFFASMNQPGKSLFLSLTRQLIFIVPLLILLPPRIGVDGVWWTSPISDVAAAICAVILLIRERNRQKELGMI
ncbi:MAG: MATE family efflux transporter [Proteobacteria bacterium]|nr:MATE family efflux transporter [Pseudomonadota bacterium]